MGKLARRGEFGSIAVYKLPFTTRPPRLRWRLYRIMLPQLRREPHKRLQALARFLARKKVTFPGHK